VALAVGARSGLGRVACNVSRPRPCLQPTGPCPVRAQTEMLNLAIQSNPSGAEVFVAGENETIGKTPFRRKFEYREDKSTFLVFRLPGYRELTHEVRPDWSGLVVLDPTPAQPPLRSSLPLQQRAASLPDRVTARTAKLAKTTARPMGPARSVGNAPPGGLRTRSEPSFSRPRSPLPCFPAVGSPSWFPPSTRQRRSRARFAPFWIRGSRDRGG